MTTQTAISVKIDSFLLDELEQYCKDRGRKRNREINIAINFYLRLRRIEAAEPEAKATILKQFLKESIAYAPTIFSCIQVP